MENLVLLDLSLIGCEGQVGFGSQARSKPGLLRGRWISCNSGDTADAGPICDGATDDGANCNQPSERSPRAADGRSSE